MKALLPVHLSDQDLKTILKDSQELIDIANRYGELEKAFILLLPLMRMITLLKTNSSPEKANILTNLSHTFIQTLSTSNNPIN